MSDDYSSSVFSDCSYSVLEPDQFSMEALISQQAAHMNQYEPVNQRVEVYSTKENLEMKPEPNAWLMPQNCKPESPSYKPENPLVWTKTKHEELHPKLISCEVPLRSSRSNSAFTECLKPSDEKSQALSSPSTACVKQDLKDASEDEEQQSSASSDRKVLKSREDFLLWVSKATDFNEWKSKLFILIRENILQSLFESKIKFLSTLLKQALWSLTNHLLFRRER